MLLPDVNVWLALAFESHHHYSVAASRFRRSSPRPCVFCRLTRQGFLHLASNPSAFGGEADVLLQASPSKPGWK
jgi:predicted nucleic acid-binding protein